MSAFSNWPLSSGSCRLDLHDRCFNATLSHPLIERFMLTAAGFYHRAAGHFMRRSEHDEHLMAYVTSGHGYLQIGDTIDRIYEVGPGSLWWIPPNVPHYYYASPDQPWSVYWAHIQKSEATTIYNLIGFEHQPVVRIGVSPDLVQGFERILHGLREQQDSISVLASASASLRAWLCDVAVILEKQCLQQASLVDKANKVFEQRLGQKFSLDDIAAEFNLSKFHFSRKYKKLTGKSPASAFMEYKINYACELLRHNKKTISQISYQLGFSDETYFTKVFTKHIGLTPSRYRAALATHTKVTRTPY
jgi:AraC family transcriptional regulator, arabinose operon regulatory protein